MPSDEQLADEAYEWTVRILYTLLVAGNLLLVWEAYRNTPAGLEWQNRARRWWAKLLDCEGCARRREWFQAQVGRMLWEATEIVEQADQVDGGGGNG